MILVLTFWKFRVKKSAYKKKYIYKVILQWNIIDFSVYYTYAGIRIDNNKIFW